MFDFLKKKVVAPDDVLVAPIKGMAVPSSSINDPTFGQEMLGKGMAIEPSEGKLYSPIDGSVAVVIDTKHALSIVSDNGAEILMHVGLDTVKLKGKYFTPKVSVGDKVKKGDLILEFDIDALKGEGFDVITPIIICNSDIYKEVKTNGSRKFVVGKYMIENSPCLYRSTRTLSMIIQLTFIVKNIFLFCLAVFYLTC